MEPLLALLFGLLIGSFLNVCIYRWPRDLSVVRPRSHCPACEAQIAAWDNIPLVSYIMLAGKCRKCSARISPRYPLVEFATGALFFYFVAVLGPTLLAIKMCCLGGMLIALIFTDLEERILPDEFTIGGTVVGLIFSAFVPFSPSQMVAPVFFWPFGLEVTGRWASVAESAAGAFIPGLLLWGGGWLYYKIRHREGLGLGDVKLIAMVGSFLGLQGALQTLIIGSVAGSILGYVYIRFTRQDPDTYELPFGTFLGAGALLLAAFVRAG
jgi:leader peptidase (prepilin peptidase)/N-methyltransferase